MPGGLPGGPKKTDEKAEKCNPEMPFTLLTIGVILQVMDRLLAKETMLSVRERLNLFITYYQPFLSRRQFFGMLVVVSFIVIGLDYLLNKTFNLVDNVIILSVLIMGLYLAILGVAIFDYVFLKKTDVSLNFLILEMELIRQLSLALVAPLFGLAYLFRVLLLIFIYPYRGDFSF